jgi:hypothetical protein
MEPSNNRASIDADLSICHMCGEPAARWAQVLVRTVGVCRDHAAGPAAAINAIPAVIDGEEARAVQAQAIDNARKEPTMPEIRIRALPTDTINAQSRMSGAVADIAAECSPEHASRLCAAWADLSDVINSSCVAFERDAAVAAEKVESAHRLIDHQIAWAIGQIAANEGAELTVAQIADAIGEDRAAGHMRPTISKLDALFDEADLSLDAEHPSLCRLLDGALS